MSPLFLFIGFVRALVIFLESVQIILYYSYDCSCGYVIGHHASHMILLKVWSFEGERHQLIVLFSVMMAYSTSSFRASV